MKIDSSILTVFSATVLLFSSISNGVAASTRYAVETDPATMLLNGYAAHIRIAPASFTRWSFGFGTYALDVPDLMIDMNSANRDQGWESRLQSGNGIFGEYFLSNSYKGWYIGGQISQQRYQILNNRQGSEKTQYVNALLMFHWGYRWYPSTKSNWYLQPWLGLGYTRKLSGETHLGDQNYEIDPIMTFTTVHVGYSFQ